MLCFVELRLRRKWEESRSHKHAHTSLVVMFVLDVLAQKLKSAYVFGVFVASAHK